MSFKKYALRLVISRPSTLAELPEEDRTRAVCMAAIALDGQMIQFVPEAFRDYDLCFLAMQKSGHWNSNNASYGGHCPLSYVPPHLRDDMMIETAIQANGYNLLALDEAYRSDALIDIAVSSRGHVLSYPGLLSESQKTYRRYLKALSAEQDPLSLDYVPKAMRDYKICYTALKNARFGKNNFQHPMGHIPRDLIDDGMIKAFVKLPDMLEWLTIPKEFHTDENYLLSIAYNGDDWVVPHYVREDFINAYRAGHYDEALAEIICKVAQTDEATQKWLARRKARSNVLRNHLSGPKKPR